MAPNHKKGWINKKSAQHFNVVWRPQNDPLIHDSDANPMVLNPTQLPNTNKSYKSKQLDDLASILGDDVEKIRDNEGEAASHGIYYDDTEYDYMQHMRDLGTGHGDSYFLDAPLVKAKGKAAMTRAFDVALKSHLDDNQAVRLDDEILPSRNLRKMTYQAQQDIPDALAGLQPDMDFRLREALEALDDDAYVDENEDIFDQLVADGEELDEIDFEEITTWEEDDDEAYDSDDTAKPTKEYRDGPATLLAESHGDLEDHGEGEWNAIRQAVKTPHETRPATKAPSQSGIESSLFSATTHGGRRKRRKGALTDRSDTSMMSSASLARTDGLRTLDQRFEKLEAQYRHDEDDDMASVSAASSMSSVQGPLRGDFDDIMNDFLGNYTKSGKRNVRKGRYQSGMEQLDEIRKGLGAARIGG